MVQPEQQPSPNTGEKSILPLKHRTKEIVIVRGVEFQSETQNWAEWATSPLAVINSFWTLKKFNIMYYIYIK